ncbi:hypothetical protein T12_7835 [Trichinella patagoniensis]|uniref:Uncharacterized protein n=1 Tax=Trichinella patagoniensis TaxID=990121 RepID=A0A0V0ZBF3_9BILA|nr:hypothetical protein T12_7835 [Trichinella patagoniensis]
MERKCRGRGEEKSETKREGCPSEAQEDVDWLTATDALVSRAPVATSTGQEEFGQLETKKSTGRDKEGACEDRAPEYFQKHIYRSVVMTCRRFQHAVRESI